MPHISTDNAYRISDEVKDVIRAQDGALLAQSMLFTTVVASARDAGLRFADQQKVFVALHAAAGATLNARHAFGDGLKILRDLAPKTGAAEVLEGCVSHCPTGLDIAAPQAVEAAPPPASPVIVEIAA